MRGTVAWSFPGFVMLGLLTDAGSAHGQVTLLPPTDVGLRSVTTSPLPIVACEPMSLNQVIATVLTADPKLRIGSEVINQAVAESATASLRPNPTLGIDTQLIPLTRNFTPTQQGGPTQFDAVVSYPIDWFLFGKRRAAMASAAIGIRQTESEYYDLVRQRIRDASLQYFDVLELRSLLEVAHQDVERMQRVESITQQAVAKGGRPAIEGQQVRLDLLRSRQFHRETESQLKNAKARLRALLGRSDSNPDFDIAGSLDLSPTLPTLSVDEAFNLAQANRPDLNALRYKIAKAEADAIHERTKAYPAVSAKSGYTRQFQGPIGYPDANSYLIGVDIGLPIFDRNQGNRVKASSLLAQAQYEWQLGQVTLRSDIEQTLNEYRIAYETAQTIGQEHLKLAEMIRDNINKANAAGGVPTLDVLEAQRTYRETVRLHIASQANTHRAATRLNATLGKTIVP